MNLGDLSVGRGSWIPGKRATRIKRRRQPGVEWLEGRCLLAALAFSEITTSDQPFFFIASGPDGHLWFAENGANTTGAFGLPVHTPLNKIGMFNPLTKTFKEFTTPAPDPLDITVGPDNNLWFTATKAITTFNLTTQTFQDFPITSGG